MKLLSQRWWSDMLDIKQLDEYNEDGMRYFMYRLFFHKESYEELEEVLTHYEGYLETDDLGDIMEVHYKAVGLSHCWALGMKCAEYLCPNISSVYLN